MRFAFSAIVLLASIGASEAEGHTADASPAPSVAGPDNADVADRALLHARFQGEWTYVGGDAERLALAAAIDRSVQTLFPVIKAIARGKVQDRTKIASACAFSFPGSNIRADVRGLGPMVSPESGRAVPFDAGDGEVKLSQRFEGNRLVQTFQSADGARVNAFDLRRDGQSFVMSVVVASPRLSAPVRYSLTYSKAPTR